MKILLVNSNPVVSRLTSLSARKESVELDEIKNVSELKNSDYNIVFVDSDSFSDEISAVLKNSHIKRKVLFYSQGDVEKDEMFNYTILKPFLPSEVSSILRQAKIDMEKENSLPVEEKPKEEYVSLDDLILSRKENTPSPTLKLFEDEPKDTAKDKKVPSMEDKLLAEIRESQNRLDNKLDKIEKNFDLDLKDLEKDLTSTQPVPKPIVEEKRPVETKIDLKDIKLEEDLKPKPTIKPIDPIFDEEPILTPPAPPKPKSEPKPVAVKAKIEEPRSMIDDFEDFNDELFELDTPKIDKKVKESKPDINSSNNIDLFIKENIEKEDKDDDILMLDVDSSNEVDFGKLEETKKFKSKKIEVKKDTEKDEASKINDFIDNSIRDDKLSLDNGETTPLVSPKAKDVEAKADLSNIKIEDREEDTLKEEKTIKKDSGSKETPEAVKRVFKDTVGSLPIEELRQLLRGTKIHITVEFPKDV